MSKYDPVQYWEERAKTYDVLEFQNPKESELLYESLKYYNYFLEVGPGAGRVYLYLKGRLNINYQCCDISKSMRDKFYRNTGINPDPWDGVTLPYGDGGFEVVISFNVLLHVPSNKIMKHLSELLRVGRYVYIATYNGKNKKLSKHCFSHDYETMFMELNASILMVERFKSARAHYFLRSG
jgi:hypothetical protein